MTATLTQEPSAPAETHPRNQSDAMALPLPHIAVLMRHSDALEEVLKKRFTTHYLRPDTPLSSLPPQHLAAIRAIVTVGGRGLHPFTFDDFPALELVAVTGAGYEQVDVGQARARGIQVSYGKGTNSACVADHALALLLASARDLVPATNAVRLGNSWEGRGAQLSGKRVGIIGLGDIGRAIARRVSGFDAQVFYHGRHAQSDVPYRYFEDPVTLAQEVDYLVVSCPGGPQTRHLVDRKVLNALGPQGILVNIARGSVIDTAALTDALRNGGIRAAAVDVIEGEPHIGTAIRALPNLIITPHIASQSPETQTAVHDLLLKNLHAHFDGFPVPTPAPAL
jgi:lactate dehydrogenase-like 2-hydroxyacid dehydrogenase